MWVLETLRAAGLYCSRRETELFTLRTKFRHMVSRDGIEADLLKVVKVRNQTRPRTVWQVPGFPGLIRYLRKFIPLLVEHTAVFSQAAYAEKTYGLLATRERR
jgi:hypothetical protein